MLIPITPIALSTVINYGLLGAEFIPNDSRAFSLEVLVSTNHEYIFHQSIASQLDQVRVGLPSEYSQSLSSSHAFSYLGFHVHGSWFMVYGLWFMVHGISDYEHENYEPLTDERVVPPTQKKEWASRRFSVIDAAVKSLDEEILVKLGSGVLRFDQAAHSEIGSSNKFFRRIATTVVQLLIIDQGSSNQEVTEVVKTYSLV